MKNRRSALPISYIQQKPFLKEEAVINWLRVGIGFTSLRRACASFQGMRNLVKCPKMS